MLYFDILTTIFCTIKLDITPYRKQPSPSIGPIKKSHFTFLCCCVFLLDNKIDCPFLDDSMAKCEWIMFEYCDWCSAPSTNNNNTMMANNLKKKQTYTFIFFFQSLLCCVVWQQNSFSVHWFHRYDHRSYSTSSTNSRIVFWLRRRKWKSRREDKNGIIMCVCLVACEWFDSFRTT